MITVSSFAIGDRYIEELEGLEKSILANSPNVNIILGRGEINSNVLDVNMDIRSQGGRTVFEWLDIPIPQKLVCNWNNIGFIKAYWIWYIFFSMRKYNLGDIQLWLDADARVRGDLSVLIDDLGDHDVGMVKFNGDHWLNGTIALRDVPQNEEWVKRWWARCADNFRPVHTDWRFNDQIIMRNMMKEGDEPFIVDLGEKWASLPPQLVGSKDKPIPVKPRDPNALIWHWQASRGEIKGWNWPPQESERPK